MFRAFDLLQDPTSLQMTTYFQCARTKIPKQKKVAFSDFCHFQNRNEKSENCFSPEFF